MQGAKFEPSPRPLGKINKDPWAKILNVYVAHPPPTMRETRTRKNTPARTSPGQTRSAPTVEEPGRSGAKLASGTNRNRQWTRSDNLDLMTCYFKSKPQERGFMRRMHDQWTTMRPSSTLNEKQLVTQRLNIVKKGFLSRLEIEEVRNKCEGSTSEKEYRPSQQSEEVHPQPTLPKVATTETLRKSAAEMRQQIVTRISHLETASRSRLPRLGGKLPEDMLEDINAALLTIPSHSITETNTLMYATAAVTLETLGYKITWLKDQARTEKTSPQLHHGGGDLKRRSRQQGATSAN